MDDRRGPRTVPAAPGRTAGRRPALGSRATEGLLLRQEIALLKAELRGMVGQLSTGAAFAAAGAVVAFAGFLYVLAAAMFGLGKILDMWLAALIVGVVVILIGGALVMVGRSRLQAGTLAPRRTIRSLKDDAEWAREQIDERSRSPVIGDPRSRTAARRRTTPTGGRRISRKIWLGPEPSSAKHSMP